MGRFTVFDFWTDGVHWAGEVYNIYKNPLYLEYQYTM